MDDLQLYEEPETPKKYIFKNIYQQDFSIPSGILHYLTHTPTASPNGYKKLQKSCKYFYFKKQIIVFNHLKWSAMQQICRNNSLPIYNFETSTYKIWLTKVLIIYGQNNENFITPFLMPKIYRSDISVLNICYHDISFGDYKILVGEKNVAELTINDAMIMNDKDGTIVPFESMLELLPNLYALICTVTKNNELIFNSKTAQKMCELPPFLSLNRCIIYGISALFNPAHFCDFVKNHKHASYFLSLCPTVSIELQESFKAVLDENSVIHESDDNKISIEKYEI